MDSRAREWQLWFDRTARDSLELKGLLVLPCPVRGKLAVSVPTEAAVVFVLVEAESQQASDIN